jgi:DNA-binding transcriptional MerR regulator/GNAT superfamily N-acetyltransferase
LAAAEVDPQSGYRRYLTSQIPQAQMIKRFRELRLPLNEIRQLLASPDGSTRNAIMAAHLRRLEDDLERTRSAVSELRGLLEPPAGPVTISHRHIAPMLAAAIGERVDAKHAVAWLSGALAELHSTLASQSRRATAPAGGLFSDQLFAKGRGMATIYIPCDGPIESIGRVRPYHSAEVEVATIVHAGSHRTLTWPMEPWPATWRVMSLPRTGPCGSIGAAYLARDGHAQLGISVLPRSRGQGIGGALLERCAARARNWGMRVMFMNCLVENAAMIHLARKPGLKIAVSGADAEAFVRLPRADLTSLAADAVAEHLGLFDHAQKSYWMALQARHLQ